MRKLPVLCAVILGCMILWGCGSARRSEPLMGSTGSKKPVAGESAYMKHCHQCHPGGDAGLGPALNNKPAPGFLIKYQVRHGLGAMPSFSETQISEAELDSIVAYMMDLRHQK